MKVSVIIPVYNGAAFLRQAIDSALAQTHPGEIWAVDDGSTDESLTILQRYGSRIQILSKPRGGVAAARNAGLMQAAGDYIAFLDQDDLWEPDKTVRQLAAMQDDDLDYVLSRQRFYLEAGCERPAWLKPEALAGDHAGFVLGAMLARRRVFDRLGLLEPRFRYADDTSWFFRAKDARLTMRHLPQVHLHKRVHAGNASANVRPIQRELLAVARESVTRQREASA